MYRCCTGGRHEGDPTARDAEPPLQRTRRYPDDLDLVIVHILGDEIVCTVCEPEGIRSDVEITIFLSQNHTDEHHCRYYDDGHQDA